MPGQLRKRLLLWALVAVCITVLGLLFLVLIPQEKTQVLASWSARLSAMADDRRDAIEHWVQAGQEDAEVIASLTTSDQLDDLLTEMIRHHEYSSVMIMDAGGVSMAGRGEPVRSDTDYRRLVGQVIGDRIPGVEFYSRDGRIAVVFAAPVFSARDSVAIGAVLLSEDPLSWLYPFLSAEPVPTMTGESNLVVAEDGRLVYLVPLVYSDAPPLTLYRPLDEPGSAPAAALKGGEDCGFYLDYRDVWVLAATRRVKGTPWGLVVKVDREEVFADSRARSRNLVTAVFGVLLAAGGLGFGLMREQRLRSERHYRELFEHNPHPMWVHDLETMRFLAVNVAAVSRYGYTQDEFLHMTLADLHPAEDMPRLLESLARNWMEPAHDTFGEWRQLRKDGTSIVVDLDAHMMAFGDRSARLVVAYDITDRVRAETALKESEKRYRSFFEDDLTGDFIADLDGTLKDCNPAFAHIFEFGSVEEAMTVPVTDLYPDPTVRERILDRLRVVKQIKYLEIVLRRRDERPVHVVENLVGIFDEQGELTGVKGYLFDITGHKVVEEQLRQSQKMEAIGRLAGGIAHDFNNMLTAIQGYTEILLLKYQDETRTAHHLQEIQKAAQRAGTLTRQLLTFSRREVVQPQVIAINTIIKHFEGMLQRVIGEDIELQTRLGEHLPSILMDPGHLEQVIMNLVVNARDAMPLGGRITVETNMVDIDAEIARSRPKLRIGTYVQLIVSDTGCGMDSETIAHLFEPFFTTKKKGTGLGLATVYGIVQQVEGDIRVYSHPEQGSTFKVWIPPCDATSETDGEVESAPVPRGDETVLVVEDEKTVRDLLVRTLELQGYKVLPAESGQGALEILAEHGARIRLLLTDVIMPNMSGRELADQAARLHPALKVLFMSGYTDGAIEQHGVLAPGVSLLHKPFTLVGLARKVRETLDG